MITLNRCFVRLLMMGAFSHVCSVPGCVGDEEVLECRILGIYVDFFGGGVSSGIEREGAAAHGVRLVLTCMSCLQKAPKIMCLCSVLYVLLQWWFLCVCLQVCVGPVCEGHDADVPRTGMYTDGFCRFVNSTGYLLRVAGRWRSNVPSDPH
jgi:hypothetical protein